MYPAICPMSFKCSSLLLRLTGPRSACRNSSPSAAMSFCVNKADDRSGANRTLTVRPPSSRLLTLTPPNRNKLAKPSDSAGRDFTSPNSYTGAVAVRCTHYTASLVDGISGTVVSPPGSSPRHPHDAQRLPTGVQVIVVGQAIWHGSPPTPWTLENLSLPRYLPVTQFICTT